jgi:hypothetical protein
MHIAGVDHFQSIQGQMGNNLRRKIVSDKIANNFRPGENLLEKPVVDLRALGHGENVSSFLAE